MKLRADPAAATPEISSKAKVKAKGHDFKLSCIGLALSKYAKHSQACTATVALAYVVIRHIPAVEVGVIRIIITLAALCSIAGRNP